MPSNARCTLGSKGGTLPTSVVVIPDIDMYPATAQSIIVDLYSMESEDKRRNSEPFQHTIELHGPQGEIVRIKSTFDDGAMVNAVDLAVHQKSKHRLKPLERSSRILRMADGRLVPSVGIWSGEITIGNTTVEDTFKIFDSKGAWLALFGKPLLRRFKAVHEYDTDIVKIPKNGTWTILQNQYRCGKDTRTTILMGQALKTNQRTNFKGDHCASPSRQVPYDKKNSEPIDVPESKTAPPPKRGQNPNTEQRTNLKGDHCAPPSRQVSQYENSLNELVDEAIIEQAEQRDHPSNKEEESSTAEKSPEVQHPVTREESKKRKWGERIKRREASGLKRKMSRTDRAMAKRNRLGRPL